MRCTACGHENPEGARFCASCGASLERTCPTCGVTLSVDASFCTSCGSRLDPETPVAAPTAPAAGERRVVTVLFADLVGFSTLAEHLDPEELRTLMTETLSELTEEVERREGWVEKFIGDAIVAVYGAPIAHEDDPERAVETALSMQDAVRRRSEGTPSPLALRIGINSGLVVAGAVGDGTQTGVMGDAVNVAARLQQGAGVGEVLISASTWRRVRGGFESESAGSLEVKGRGQPVEAYRLLGRGGGGSRQRVPFVGRREELALLDLLWSSAAKGNTHVVSVVGEPGVGKSRLLEELRPTGDPVDIRISCGSERAFGPFVELVERILGGDPPKAAEELVARAAEHGVEREHALLVGSFLGLGGAPPVVRMADEQRGQQIFNGFWQFLVAVCSRRPALIALDDVHWADESSRDLLDFLLERLAGVPLMLVLCYRPGFERVERAELRASHTVVRLEALTPDESIQLAHGFLGVEQLPTDLERLVAERAEGNPFFIEELLQALIELGSLAVVDGTVVLAKVDVAIPDTVQGTVLARVDRLDPHARSVLQHAAVLGRSFSGQLLEDVAGNGSAASALETLERAQLLVRNAPGEWSFKHALIQEVTYETLLLRQRRDLHRAAAEALEQRAGDDPSLLEELAEHYALAESPEHARRYATSAGDLAAERSGYVEAVRRYQTALRVWGEGDDEGRLGLMLKLGRAAMLAGDLATARTVLIEAIEGWRARGDTQRAGGALAVLGRVYWQSGEGERATETLERAIAMLGEDPSPELVQAYNWASAGHMLSGRYLSGRDFAERGLALAGGLDVPGQRSHLLNTLGVCEGMLGEGEGIPRIEEALKVGLESGEPDAIGRGYVNLSDQYVKTGHFRMAVDIAEEGRVAMRKLGAPAMEWFIAGNEALALVLLGRYDEADSLTLEMLDEQRAVLGVTGLANAGFSRAELLTRRGLLTEARAIADETLHASRGLGGAEFLGQALVLEAELELARGNGAAARQALREAVEIATEEDLGHLPSMLPAAARLLTPDEVEELIERVSALPSSPLPEAQKAEARAVLAADPALFLEAAALYRTLETPYEEARCLAAAGDEDTAAAIYERLGVPAPTVVS